MERSTESFCQDAGETVGNMRRKSTQHPTSSHVNGEGKIPPNYLRNSTGSCHHLCKYGMKHEFESKGKQPIHLPSPEVRNTRKLEDVKQSGFSSSRIIRSPRLKIESTLKRSTEFHTKQLVKSSPPNDQRVSNDAVDDLNKQLFDAPRFQKKAAPPGSPARLDGNTSEKSHNYSLRRKVRQTDPVIRHPKVSREISSGTASAGTTFKDIGISEVKEITEVDLPTNSLSPPDQCHELSTAKEVVATSRKVGIPSTSRLNSTEKLKKPPLQHVPWNSGGRTAGRNTSKDSSSIKVKSREVKPSNFSTLNSHAPRTTELGSRNSRNKRVSTASWSSPLANGHPSLMSLKSNDIYVRKARYSTSSSIGHPGVELSNVKLHAECRRKNPSRASSLVAPSSRSSSSSSSPWSSSWSQSSSPTKPSPSLETHQGCSHSESHSGRRGGDEPENRVKCSGKDERKSGRISSSESEGDERDPRTVYFRRGTVVDVQEENGVPQRLRFRERKLVGEHDDDTGEAVKMNSTGRNVGTDDPNKGETRPIVLRHQDVQAKKDTQDLNQVIEETASRLVESRKSKVKALVGAFESVISLQDPKPMPT